MKKTLVCAITALLAGYASGEEATASIYDQIWGAVKFVDNDDAKVLNSLALTGRLQGDAHSFHSEENNDNIVWRRFRFGAKATIFQDIVLHSELDLDMNKADSGNSWDDFYNRLTDSYVAWSPCKNVKVKLGKQSAGFTLDGATSSKKLIVPERSIVAENIWFPTEYFTGASISGSVADWTYNAGGFSSSGEAEFGHFESGYFALLSAGHKVGEKGSLRLDYVYNDPDYTGVNEDPDYTVGTKNLEHVIALVYKTMINEKLGLWADVAGATGIDSKGQSDLVGVDIMPFYNISDSFQLVLQYAGVSSTDNKSQISMSRYASRNTGKTKVEASHNLLLGFNWYLYGHKLKWQNAVEYNYGKGLATTGEDYNGYGVTSALRMSW